MLYGIASEQGRHAEQLATASRERGEIAEAVAQTRSALTLVLRDQTRTLREAIDEPALSMRAGQMEVAPTLANLGVIDWPATKIETVVVGSDVWMFPADAESGALIEAGGFKRERLGAPLSGHRVGSVDMLPAQPQ
jgi:hypothetical protein